MSRVRLIRWNEDEAAERAERLRAYGYKVTGIGELLPDAAFAIGEGADNVPYGGPDGFEVTLGEMPPEAGPHRLSVDPSTSLRPSGRRAAPPA